MFKFQQKLHRLKAALKTWNFKVFGNIFQNICKAEQKAKDCEKRYDDNPTDENLISMNKATAELTFALSGEECYWKQKAACRWLTEGEKNTKYFHTLIKKKRKQSLLDFFHGTPPPKNFTTASIVLIPKTESPETWKDFRPISLCNVSGKILSKLMNHQELVHCLGANGSNNNILKLDMAKAYDRLDWNFLYRMLSRIGFPV
ncbi:hypothetical protein Sango_2695100 [Sesamum angolense]|uniref:Reverse transcriptase domain-containing protein n=1 Tax=Sesamum angolense TaxID=2727404 RepID=A0AAE1W2S7_9LAMI|nr:hypothetical protein Sango_2695100 [Sesamum angolense]